MCKHCRAGVLVPKDAESLPESAEPIEPPTLPFPPAPERASAEPETNGQFTPKPAVRETPIKEKPVAKREAIEMDDAPPADRRRMLVLLAVLGIVLVVGGAAIAYSVMKRNSPVVVVDAKKLETNKAPEQNGEKKTPEIVEPITPKEEIKGPELVVLEWYTAEDVPCFAPSMDRLPIDETEREKGLILLVVKARVSGAALAAAKSEIGFKFALFAEDFEIHDTKGGKAPSNGLESNGGFAEVDEKTGFRFSTRQTSQVDKVPIHQDVGMLFVVPEDAADEFRLQLTFRSVPFVKLEQKTRRETPPAPKKVEPEKKVEVKKTPDPVEPEKKIEVKKELPKPVEPEKKVDDKIPVKPIEPEKKPAVKVELPKLNPDVEIVEWYASETLPGTEPGPKVMALTTADREDGNIFVVVKVKLSAKAKVAKKAEKGWNIRFDAKDFSIAAGDKNVYFHRGLERAGGFGYANAKLYLSDLELTEPIEREPTFWVQSVFFILPRKVAEHGELEMTFRDFSAVSLTKINQKK